MSVVGMPGIPALGRWVQEDEEFKVILGCTVSLRLARAIMKPCLKHRNKKKKKKEKSATYIGKYQTAHLHPYPLAPSHPTSLSSYLVHLRATTHLCRSQSEPQVDKQRL